MSKKSKKVSRQKHSTLLNFKQPPAVILKNFKSLWALDAWEQALSCYRTWTNRTGRKRNPVIEGELLFRCASSLYSNGNYKRSADYLKEACSRDPGNMNRYNFYMPICLAKNGQLFESLEIWKKLGDKFHQAVVSYYLEQKSSLPQVIEDNLAIEKSQLLRFWKYFTESKNEAVIETSNRALKNIGEAFLAFSSGGNPEQQLKLLKKKTGFNSLADYFLCLSAVYNRRKIKVRNFIAKHPFTDLIDIHIRILFREKDYDEIIKIDKLLNEHSIKSESIEALHDELFFNLGLKEIKANHLEKALTYFLDIRNKTQAVLHNTALLYQKTGRYEEANKIWMRFLKQEKKPKKSDPEERIAAYITMCKYIASNFWNIFQVEKAREYFKEVLTLVNDDREAIKALIDISDELNNLEDAILYSRRMYELEPDNEENLFFYIVELRKNAKIDTLIPLYKKGLEIDSANPFYKEGLAYCFISNALALRHNDPKEAKRLMKETKKLGFHTGRFMYLKGYFLYQSGKKKSAREILKKAFKNETDHFNEFQIGVYLYEDGFIDLAIEAFETILSCECEISRIIFKDVLKFLIKQNDETNTIKICDFAVNNLSYYLYDLADLLFTYEKFRWAKRYSSQLIKLNSADEEDKFLHLLILNKLKESEEMISYLNNLITKAEQKENNEDLYAYKKLLKQVKAKGRFKTPWL